MFYRKCLGALVLSFILFVPGYGQLGDTLKLTLHQADSLFIRRNLLLLAQRYSVSENEAYVMQAKIWDLPNVTINHNLYNPENHKYLEISSGSETSVQMEQLILMGGKRSKLVSLAQTNAQIAQYQYLDLLRNLKYQLRSALYNVYFTAQKLRIYETEVPLLNQVVSGYETMYPKGFVSLKEVVRLKALLFSLENDKLGLLKQLHDNEDTLRLMLNERTQRYIQPLPDLVLLDSVRFVKLSLSTLVDTALRNRADLLVYQLQTTYTQTDLSYQKSQNVPNPTAIAGWDHNGSFVRNYNYIGVSIDLPFWNKNRGNIRAGEARVAASKALYDHYVLQVSTQIANVYSKAVELEKLYRSTDSGYGDDFTKIIRGTTENFLKHQIGLLEFVDLYESYKTSQTQVIQLQNDRINAIESLSYIVGKSLN